MIVNILIKSLNDIITKNKYHDSDYWYFGGNIEVINLFKNFDASDLQDFEKQIIDWKIEDVEILIDCLIFGYLNESTLNKQSYFLTFLLANPQVHLDIRVELLELAADFILKGTPKPIELMNSIISWIKINKYDEIPNYHSQCLKIYEAQKLSIKQNIVNQKIDELRKEILLLTKLIQAFDEVDGLSDKALSILGIFNIEDFKQLKLDLLLWDNAELETLAKILSKGDSNGNLLDDNYFYGYLFVLLPATRASALLDDMFYFFENQNLSCYLLLQIKNKLNELIAKRYIERNAYDYWIKEIAEKQKTCN